MFCMHFILYYDIYWTNILTRCHSASFCLLCLCIAEKVQKWKCSEKSEKITEILFRQKTPGARRTSPGEAHSPHTPPGRGWALAAPRGGVAASVTSSRRPLDYILPPRCKPKNDRRFLQKSFVAPPPPKTLIRGTEVSVPVPCRDGEVPPEPSSSPLLLPMMRRE